MFSNLSESSISLATVTPSLVMRGAPYDLLRRTLRPLGPSVTLTALARMSMPRNMRSRASPLNLTSLAAMIGSSWLGGFLLRGGPIEHAHDVGFLHDHQVFAIELDLGARPFREQHAIAALDVERVQLATLVAGAGTDGEDFAFHRLFLRRVGDEDAAGGLRLRIDAADQNAVLQGTQFHLMVSSDQICRERFGTVRSRVPARTPDMGARSSNTMIKQSELFILSRDHIVTPDIFNLNDSDSSVLQIMYRRRSKKRSKLGFSITLILSPIRRRRHRVGVARC